MTALDEAPEQRWRRTVDRRNRPAKLKVDRLLRDFGYAELDAEVGDAIEARLAGVALAVAPSLRDAVAGEVVTIYASDGAASEAGASAPVAAGAVDPVAAEVPAVASDVAQMVTYLKQQVFDARAEAERLRTELDRRIAARMDAERENEAIIAEQAAALEAQTRQLAELGAALDSTRQALAETRDEIRRAVGELQALPEPVPADVEVDLLAEDEAAGAGEEDFGLGDEEWSDGPDEAEAAALVAEPAPDEGSADDAEERRDPPIIDLDEPAPVTSEAPVAAGRDTSLDLDDLEMGVPDRPAEPPDAAFELDEPEMGADQAPAAEAPDASLALDEPVGPALDDAPADGAAPELDVAEPAAASDAPAPQAGEFDVEPHSAETWARDDIGDLPSDIPHEPADHETRLHALSDPEEPATAPPPQPEPVSELDSPLPPASDWLPADLRATPDPGAPAAEPLPVGAGDPEGELTDFDDFLYDAEELYDPEPEGPAGGDAVIESEIEARWPDEPAAALPPPPPAPPSPFGEELAPEAPDLADRATRGKVLRGRGRGGRGRGRWEGRCSICGREPQVNRRKDLQAAGWDLDDDAAACPQCRGVG